MTAAEDAGRICNVKVLRQSLAATRRQLDGFERERRDQPGGFYYSDFFNHR